MQSKKLSKSTIKSTSKASLRTSRPTRPIAKVTKQVKKPVFFSKLNKWVYRQKKGFKQLAKKISKNIKSFHKKSNAFLSTPGRLAIIAVAILAILIATHGSQTSAAGSNGLVSVNIFQQKQESPKAVTAEGPGQGNKQFSTYPTWAQNYSHYGSSILSKKYWNVNLGWPNNGNNEAEYYTDNAANLRISGGSLIMAATMQTEPGGLQYASSRIDTQGKLSFLYGRFDVTAKLPSGVGTWPAIWFLPANTKYEDLSPSSDTTRFLNGGEIDMVEAVGFNPNIVYGVVHTLQTNQSNPNSVGDFNQITLPNNNTQYYKYSLLWTPTTITFEINDSPYFTYTKTAGADFTTWPFDQPMYMIINLALGGVWGGEDTAQFPNNGIDNSALPAFMSIKSIYYYPYIGQ